MTNRKKYYKFDECYLTEDEKKILQNCNNSIDKIYKRIHNVILEKEKIKKSIIREQKKKKEKEIILNRKKALEKKIKDFPEHFEKFKKDFYNKLFEKENTDLLHKNFQEFCIHPIQFKTKKIKDFISFYRYDPCDTCEVDVCGLCNLYYNPRYKLLEFNNYNMTERDYNFFKIKIIGQ